MFRKISRGCLLALLACPLAALAEPIYSMSFLPAGFDGRAMNGVGHIVGNTGAGVSIWNGSALIDLGLGADSVAFAINNRGDVAGSLNGSYSQPFLYTSGIVRHAGPALEDVQGGRAHGLNDLGQVAGDYATFGGDGHAWVDTQGSVRMLGTLDGTPTWSAAMAINNHGQIVGGSTYAGANSIYTGHAFLYQDGTMVDLGTFGGSDSFANDINDAGQVVGWTTDDKEDRLPFIYTDGAMRLLGPDDDYVTGDAIAINNAGMVVGWTQDDWGAPMDAFLYAGGELSSLDLLVGNTDRWRIVEAYDINDAGQILGKACRADECLSVRLDLVSAVPEPGGYALLTAGLVLLGWRSAGKRESPRFS